MSASERTRLERDEWALAGDLERHALERACTSLALTAAKANHEAAEGVEI